MVLGRFDHGQQNRKTLTGFPFSIGFRCWVICFAARRTTRLRTELIILMRPEVTLTKLDLYRLRQTTQEKMAAEKDLDKHPPLNQGEYEEEYESPGEAASAARSSPIN